MDKPPRSFKVSVWQKREGQQVEVHQEFSHGLEQAVHRFDAQAKAWPDGEARIEEEVDGKWVEVSADELRKET